MGVDKKGRDIEIGEISQQRPKTYQRKRQLSQRDNVVCSMKSVEWAPQTEKFKPKLFTKRVAGATSNTCNNTNLFVQIESRGKKKFVRENESLHGIL